MPGSGKQKNVSMKRPTKRDAETESLKQVVAVPTLAPCVTIAFIASGNRWPPLDKRSVKLSSPTLLRQTQYNLSQLSGTLTNGSQLTPTFISKRRQSVCMLKNFNKHNVRQRSSANINSYKRSATFTGGAGRLSKRRSKRRSVNPALMRMTKVRRQETQSFKM